MKNWYKLIKKGELMLKINLKFDKIKLPQKGDSWKYVKFWRM